MLLRSRSVSRLPVAVLRLCYNSVPSTSSSIYLTPTYSVISRCHLHVDACSNPQLSESSGASLAWFRDERGVRARLKDARTDDSSSSSNNAGEDPVNSKLPSTMKTLIVASVFSLLLNLLLLPIMCTKSALADGMIPDGSRRINFRVFAKKYLRTGQVPKMTFVAEKKAVVGILDKGAIIDGKPAKSRIIVVNYPHSPQQFLADVRKEEAEMGIDPSQGLHIKIFDVNRVQRKLSLYFFLFMTFFMFLQLRYLSTGRRFMSVIEKRMR